MKISSNSDKGLIEIDTDKLSDVEAAVLEKASELLQLCKTFDVRCFLLYEGRGEAKGISMDYYVGKDMRDPGNWNKFWNFVGYGINRLSNNRITIGAVPEQENLT